MSAVVEAIGDVFEAVGDAVGDVVEGIGDVVESVVDNVVEPVAKAVGNTIEAALDNPIGTIARVAAVATGQFQLLPLIGAAETAANGGDFGDIMKSAAINYVAGQVGSNVSQFTGNQIVANAAAGATDAALHGGDPLQGALSSAINTGFNQLIDSTATALNTPTPNTDDLSFQLPESIRSMGSYDDVDMPRTYGDMEPIDYSLGSRSLSDAPTSPLSGDADTSPFNYSLSPQPLSDTPAPISPLGGNYDMKPVDYSLTPQPLGDNPNARFGVGLTMDSIQGRAPGLASMGGGSGLSVDVNAPLGDPNSFINSPEYASDKKGIITSSGFVDRAAMPAIGDPTSFINNPDVTGQPVIPTPSCAYNVNLPNVNVAALLDDRQRRQNRALCLAFGGFDMNIPWLSTKEQMLRNRPLTAGCASTTSAGATPMQPGQPGQMGDLASIYNQMSPELTSVFADRGIGFNPAPQGAAGSGGLGLGFGRLGFADGGSTSSGFCSTWGEMGKYMPKFHPSQGSSMLQNVGGGRRQPATMAQLKQMYSAISQQGNMGGMAKGGLPAKYQQAAPEGHNPEFITGLTGYYANGRGTGQSDDIPAMLHDGDYVMDADTVAAFGDGSSKAGAQAMAQLQKQVPHRMSTGGKAVPAQIADGEYVFPEAFVTALGNGDNKRGAKMLDAMRENLRAHKRSAPTSKIPPKALSPLDYLKKAK